jgi:AraC-like DNA-binding protein
MPDSFDSGIASRGAGDTSFLWVNLTREARSALGHALDGVFDIRRVREHTQICGAIEVHTPLFLCFEFDEPDLSGIDALAQTRRENPSLPILMITARLSESLALWALRIRVWDVLVKPVSNGELRRRIASLIDLTRQSRSGPAREALFPEQDAEALSALHGIHWPARTYPAIAHVVAHFDSKIALHQVAALCQLCPSQFCRTFRLEHGVSFGQHLLRYRLDRACERLAYPGVLAKEVAYAVGFNDLSYFTRAFKRQVGVCPSQYQGRARSS